MQRTVEKYEVVITAFAEGAIRQIYKYIKERVSQEFAAKYEERIVNETLNFQNSHLLPECPELPARKKVYRYIVFGNYRIIGKIVNTRDYGLDAFHTKRNPTQLRKLRHLKV